MIFDCYEEPNGILCTGEIEVDDKDLYKCPRVKCPECGKEYDIGSDWNLTEGDYYFLEEP